MGLASDHGNASHKAQNPAERRSHHLLWAFSAPSRHRPLQARAEALWDSFAAPTGELEFTKVELLVETIEFESQVQIFNESERSALRRLCQELNEQQGDSKGFTQQEFFDMLRRTQPMAAVQTPPASPAGGANSSDTNVSERVHKLEETVTDLRDFTTRLQARILDETAAKEEALRLAQDREERIARLEAESLQNADLVANLQTELDAAEHKLRANQEREAIEIERLERCVEEGTTRELEFQKQIVALKRQQTRETELEHELEARAAEIKSLKDKHAEEVKQLGASLRIAQDKATKALEMGQEQPIRESKRVEELEAEIKQLKEDHLEDVKQLEDILYTAQEKAHDTEKLERFLKESSTRELALQKQVLALRKELEGHTVTIKKLNDEHAEDVKQLETSLSMAHEKAGEAKAVELKKYQARESELANELDATLAEIKKLKETHAAEIRQLEETLLKAQEAARETEACETERRQLRESELANDLRAEIKKLKEDYAEEITRLDASLRKAQAKALEIETQKTEEQQIRDLELERLNQDHSEKIKTLEASLHMAREETKQLEVRRRAEQQKAREIEAREIERQQLRQSELVDELTAEIEKLKEEHAEAIRRLEESLRLAQEETQQLEASLHAEMQKAQETEALGIEQRQSRELELVHKLKDEIQKLKEEHAEEMQRLEATLRLSQEKAREANAKEIEELEAVLSMAHEEIQQLKALLHMAQEEARKNHAAEIALLEANLRMAQEEVRALKDNHGEEIAQLEASLRLAQKAAREVEDGYAEEIKQLEAILHVAEKEAGKVKEGYAAEIKQLEASLHLAHKAARETNDSHKQDIKQLQASLRVAIEKAREVNPGFNVAHSQLPRRRSLLNHTLWCLAGFITFLPLVLVCLALRDTFRSTLEGWIPTAAFVPV
ncbi:hypothetical protein HDU86_003991 [Geranomyces michiganensis]|nr:hypothetical protein HDU86_003991 [Geranomyces michiganensis]